MTFFFLFCNPGSNRKSLRRQSKQNGSYYDSFKWLVPTNLTVGPGYFIRVSDAKNASRSWNSTTVNGTYLSFGYANGTVTVFGPIGNVSLGGWVNVTWNYTSLLGNESAWGNNSAFWDNSTSGGNGTWNASAIWRPAPLLLVDVILQHVNSSLNTTLAKYLPASHGVRLNLFFFVVSEEGGRELL
jgi:hypothetical protein